MKLISDPKFMAALMTSIIGGTGGMAATVHLVQGKYDGEISEFKKDLEKICYKDIKSCNLKKTIIKDLFINIIYRKEDKENKMSFFVVNKLNCLNKETEKLFFKIKSKIN